MNVKKIGKGTATCILPGGAKFSCPAAHGAQEGSGHLSVRPERVSIGKAKGSLIKGITSRHIYLGTDMHIDITLGDGEVITARVQNSESANIPGVGDEVGISFEASAARLLVD